MELQAIPNQVTTSADCIPVCFFRNFIQMRKTNKQLANELIKDGDTYSHARYYKKLGIMPVYRAEQKEPDIILIGPHPFIIIENGQARWAEYYEVEILRGMGPDLKNKTVFDFTVDPVILANILSFDPADHERKKFYIDNAALVNKTHDIASLARLIGNKPLETATMDHAAKLWAEWDKFAAKMAKKGLIVDW